MDTVIRYEIEVRPQQGNEYPAWLAAAKQLDYTVDVAEIAPNIYEVESDRRVEDAFTQANGVISWRHLV